GGRSGGLWKNVEKAAIAAVQTGNPQRAGRCKFTLADGALVLTLPSGRPLYYRRPQLEKVDRGEYTALSLCFDSPGGQENRRGEKASKDGFGNIERTYGGKLVENLVQALCRDLLAEALIRCERAGLPVVLHSHDEVVCEVPAEQDEAALGQLLEIMSA